MNGENSKQVAVVLLAVFCFASFSHEMRATYRGRRGDDDCHYSHIQPEQETT